MPSSWSSSCLSFSPQFQPTLHVGAEQLGSSKAGFCVLYLLDIALSTFHEHTSRPTRGCFYSVSWRAKFRDENGKSCFEAHGLSLMIVSHLS